MVETLDVNASMATLFKTACYDCHSDQPRYPWYAHIAPVSWWINGHIDHGREEINFSKWTTYSARNRDHKLEEMLEMVEKGEMPLPNYTILHKDAKLNNEQIAAIRNWVTEERAKIARERGN